MNAHVCDLELEVLSPCFMGGAYQQPEFRIGSIRGLWRYWYRALYGDGSETACSQGEEALFGATSGGDDEETGRTTGGRGKARLIPTAPLPAGETLSWTRGNQPTGADYLLFSMPMQKPPRRYLAPPLRASLRLLVRGDESDFDRVARSLAAALAFSGIGARARRMAGAVHLSAKQDALPYFVSAPAANPEVLASRLHRLLEPALTRAAYPPGGIPRYPIVADGCFSAGVLRESYARWREAMDTVGEAFRRFRQFEPVTNRRRQPDYKVARDALSGQRPGTGQTITRAAFGLPIRFRFNSLEGKTIQAELTPELMPDGKKRCRDRRGSPLFLTLERLADSRIAVVWSAFRSALTPDGKLLIGNVEAEEPTFSLLDEMFSRPEWHHYRIAG